MFPLTFRIENIHYFRLSVKFWDLIMYMYNSLVKSGQMFGEFSKGFG